MGHDAVPMLAQREPGLFHLRHHRRKVLEIFIAKDITNPSGWKI
jgi:hypothetical protein